ncbi:MAG: hypothetical protein QNJ05_05985 [Woeseiaceae bacterium]|nr:hypothetical protein [Woeseiaceae bacterium]
MKDLISVFIVAVSLSLLAGFSGATLHANETRAAEAATQSYIVQAKSMDEAVWAVEAVGGEITHELRIINAVTALLTKAQLEEVTSKQGVIRTSIDGAVRASPETGDN